MQVEGDSVRVVGEGLIVNSQQVRKYFRKRARVQSSRISKVSRCGKKINSDEDNPVLACRLSGFVQEETCSSRAMIAECYSILDVPLCGSNRNVRSVNCYH